MIYRREFTYLLLTTLCAVPSGEIAAADGPLEWETDYAAAQQTRQAEQRPLLVFMTLDGCHFCHKMLAETYTDAAVTSTVKRTDFVPTKIDGSRQQELAKRFGVRIYPTTFLIGADNRVVDRIEGFVPAAAFRQRVASATERVSVARLR